MAVGYRRMKLTVELIDEAMGRANNLPIFENSHRQGDANLVGCIGEIVFEKYLTYHQVSFKDDTTSTRHDYIIGKSLTLDVKTKDRTFFQNLIMIARFHSTIICTNVRMVITSFLYFVNALLAIGIRDDSKKHT